MRTITESADTLFSLESRVALVTGASSGLGAHFAQVLAGAGATVVAAARRADKLAQLVEGIQANGGSIQAGHPEAGHAQDDP